MKRYADDIVVHCRREKQFEMLKGKLIQRFALCNQTLHPEKTKVVYCKDANRNEDCDSVSFYFLGYTFHPRLVIDKKNAFFVTFSPAINTKSAKNIR
ncbi:MAG: reverse transcriptase domain-containing protein [bacterium]|nr:reverse transcriptase domain-containing protein [bacterium]